MERSSANKQVELFYSDDIEEAIYQNPTNACIPDRKQFSKCRRSSPSFLKRDYSVLGHHFHPLNSGHDGGVGSS